MRVGRWKGAVGCVGWGRVTVFTDLLILLHDVIVIAYVCLLLYAFIPTVTLSWVTDSDGRVRLTLTLPRMSCRLRITYQL